MKPLIGKIQDKTAIIDIPEVKEIVKDAYICWGCLVEVYIQRQKVSVKTIRKKLVNKFCINRKLFIGDTNMAKMAHFSTTVTQQLEKIVQQPVEQEEEFGVNTPIDFLENLKTLQNHDTY